MTRCSAKCVTGKRCKKYVSKDGLCSVHLPKEMVDCSICFDDIEKNSNGTVLLECGHSFCKKCIHTWIIEKNTFCSCPNCRTSISVSTQSKAAFWGLEHNYLFVSDTHYYDFSILPQIDYFILMARIFNGVVIKQYVCTDEQFKIVEENLKDDINFYEIFKVLKEAVVVKPKLFLVKNYPEKPKKLHIFIF